MREGCPAWDTPPSLLCSGFSEREVGSLQPPESFGSWFQRCGGFSLRAGSGHADAGSSPGALVYPLGRLR